MWKNTKTQWSDDEYDEADKVLQVIQYKYVWNILTHLSHNWKMAFWEIKRELSPISTKVLSERLKLLVDEWYIWNEKEKQGKVIRSYYHIDKDPEELHEVLEAFKNYAT